MQDRQKGLMMTATGVLVLSPDALMLRWVSADAMQILAWRGLLMAVGLGVLLALRYGRGLPRRLVACSWTGVGCALSYAASTMCYLTAMSLAGAASALLIYSVSPLIAGLLAWAWFGERLSRRTVVVIVASVVGIAVIVSDRTPGASLPGNLLALASAALFAANLALARSRPQVDMSPALLPGALLASGAAFALGGVPGIGGGGLVALAAMSLVLLPLGFMLVQLGPRRVGAAEVGLLLLLEVVLGPLWVWWLLDEAPSERVLVGGAIVLAALLGHTLVGWHETAPLRLARA